MDVYSDNPRNGPNPDCVRLNYIVDLVLKDSNEEEIKKIYDFIIDEFDPSKVELNGICNNIYMIEQILERKDDKDVEHKVDSDLEKRLSTKLESLYSAHILAKLQNEISAETTQ